MEAPAEPAPWPSGRLFHPSTDNCCLHHHHAGDLAASLRYRELKRGEVKNPVPLTLVWVTWAAGGSRTGQPCGSVTGGLAGRPRGSVTGGLAGQRGFTRF